MKKKQHGIPVGVLKNMKSFWEKLWRGTVLARVMSTAWQSLRRAMWDDDGNENPPEDDEARLVGRMGWRAD